MITGSVTWQWDGVTEHPQIRFLDSKAICTTCPVGLGPGLSTWGDSGRMGTQWVGRAVIALVWLYPAEVGCSG